MLGRLRHRDLKACYAVVKIEYKDGYPSAEVRQWFMEEHDTQGELLPGCSARCSAPPANCQARSK